MTRRPRRTSRRRSPSRARSRRPLAWLAALAAVLVALGWLDPTRLPQGWDAWWPDGLTEWLPGPPGPTPRPGPTPSPAPERTPAPREAEPPAPPRSANTLQGRVTHVRDGDTLEVAGTPVRIANLDCAELGTTEGESARLFLFDLVDGETLTCDLEGRRSYDREVGTCALAGEDVGEILIGEGVCGRWGG
ncbi:thermonuclease family protein [Rubellimicrobium aerolatum]|uniref:thermonuclease family protein n=1 Tax=Rubellimicrobium aerolatum TaxID=490979 RepID=UPI00366E46F1